MKDIIIRATVNDEVYETVTDLLDRFENMSDNVIDFYDVEDDNDAILVNKSHIEFMINGLKKDDTDYENKIQSTIFILNEYLKNTDIKQITKMLG